MAAFKITQGKTKGTPLEQATDEDILYCGRGHVKDLAGGTAGEFVDFKVKWLGAAREILRARGVDPTELEVPAGAVAAAGATGGAYRKPAGASTGGAYRKPAGAPAAATPPAARPASAPASTSTALAARPAEQLVSARDVGRLNQQLEDFAARCHLVTPATSCAALPEGCEIAFSMLQVNPDASKTGPGDVAAVGGGKLALSATVLKKIGAAAGVSWDPTLSGRLDNGSDPNYCHYRAVGRVRDFDGTLRTVSGEVELDLRDGSSQIEAMYLRGKESANVDSQIRDMRLFLLRHAETKAKARAIVDLGLKRSYTETELAKPFVVAKLMFTGRSDNPAIAAMMAEKIADAHLAAVSGLYGQPRAMTAAPQRLAPPHHQQLQTAPAYAPPQFTGHAPPPVGSVIDQDDVPTEAASSRTAALAQQPAPEADDYGGDPSLAEDVRY